MKKRIYKVPVKFVFEGEFYVEAESAREAYGIVDNDCHMVMGSGVQSDSEEFQTGTSICIQRNSSEG